MSGGSGTTWIGGPSAAHPSPRGRGTSHTPQSWSLGPAGSRTGGVPGVLGLAGPALVGVIQSWMDSCPHPGGHTGILAASRGSPAPAVGGWGAAGEGEGPQTLFWGLGIPVLPQHLSPPRAAPQPGDSARDEPIGTPATSESPARLLLHHFPLCQHRDPAQVTHQPSGASSSTTGGPGPRVPLQSFSRASLPPLINDCWCQTSRSVLGFPGTGASRVSSPAGGIRLWFNPWGHMGTRPHLSLSLDVPRREENGPWGSPQLGGQTRSIPSSAQSSPLTGNCDAPAQRDPSRGQQRAGVASSSPAVPTSPRVCPQHSPGQLPRGRG